MTRSNLRLLVFPVDDETLRHDVDAAVRRLPDDLPDADARSAVEAELRRWYRSASVHERDSLGGYEDDPVRVWYIFRDGRVRKRDTSLDRLYLALANARATCASSAAVLAGAHETARAAGFDHGASHAGGFEPVGATRRKRRSESARLDG